MTTSIRQSLATATLVAAVVASAGGCKSGGERALPMVQESANRALSRGDYAKAVTDYKEVITRNPGYWQDRYSYAKALMGAGRPAEAREQMEIVYTIKPNRFDVLDYLAKTMLASGDVEGMSRVLKEEARAHNTPNGWMRYGWFMAQAGDADEAERALLKAAEMDHGKSVGPQIALAELYRAAGDKPNEIERLRMAYYLDPTNPEVLAEIQGMGEVAGPTFGKPPKEAGYGQDR